ncbi:MAG: hypothetical protein ACF8Q5_13370 [Phycisphaerales bacterium JB040]
MFEPPPDGLVYTPTPNGHAWTLPPRTGLGRWRLFGLLPIGVCLIAPAVAWFVARGVLGSLLPSDWSDWAAPSGAWLLALLIFCFERKVWRFGLAVLCGRSEVRLEGGELISVERVPLVAWTWSTPGERVEEVRLSGGASDASGSANNPVTRLYGITLLVDGKKHPLVIGYPLAQLEPLAAEVAHHIERLRGEEVPLTLSHAEFGRDISDGERTDPFGRGPEDLPGSPVPQPEGSDAVVTEQDGELSVMLPPAGLKEGSKGLWGFSVVWNGLIALMLIGWVISMFTGHNQVRGWEYLGALGFLSVFVGVGVWTGLHAWSMGKRHIVIDVIGDAVVFSIASPFSTRQHTYTRDELVSIRVGPSGTEVNDRPVLELQVRHRPADATDPDDVAKRGLLASRPDDELRWLASLLTHRLGLAPDAPSGHRRRAIRVRIGGQKAG